MNRGGGSGSGFQRGSRGASDMNQYRHGAYAYGGYRETAADHRHGAREAKRQGAPRQEDAATRR